MTNEQILKKAIEKAVKNGWEEGIKFLSVIELGQGFLTKVLPYRVIFLHDFAKAFWGTKDEWHTTECTCGGVDFHLGGYDMHKMNCAKIKANRGYKFHLKEMVLKKNPLKYIEKFL